MKAVLAALFLLLSAWQALACSCLPRTEDEIIEAADVVVVGVVTEVRRLPGEPMVLATISVGRIVKGRVHRQIQVRTRENTAACGLPFQQGRIVKVAANKLSDGLNTNLCMALKAPERLGQALGADIRQISGTCSTS